MRIRRKDIILAMDLELALDRLTEFEAYVIKERFYIGRSYVDIAKNSQKSYSAVTTASKWGLSQLRTILEKDGYSLKDIKF
jgi:DNA-directed RNA polymerase specialized sigma24 family protein